MRNVFVIGPSKRLKLILVHPVTTGRNPDEVLRVIDSLQPTANHKVSTPVNRKQGDDVTDMQARGLFGDWDAARPSIGIVPQREQEPALG